MEKSQEVLLKEQLREKCLKMALNLYGCGAYKASKDENDIDENRVVATAKKFQKYIESEE